MIDRPLLAFRIVQAATLGALVWKIQFFTTIGRIYAALPLQQELFPPFFEAAETFSASYAAAILLLSLLLIVQGAAARRMLTVATLLTLSILCVHQGSYNDATFTTAWWAALWSTWFAGRMGRSSPERLLRNGARLAQAIVGMVLLGGAAGKWTSEYWSGQVFYEYPFHQPGFLALQYTASRSRFRYVAHGSNLVFTQCHPGGEYLRAAVMGTAGARGRGDWCRRLHWHRPVFKLLPCLGRAQSGWTGLRWLVVRISRQSRHAAQPGNTMSRPGHFLTPLLEPGGRALTLYVSGGSLAVATTVETAFDSASRNRGLLGRPSLPAGHALIIAPCNLVHTFRMQFPLDLIFARRNGQVAAVSANVRPGRIRGSFRAFAVIEMAAGSAARAGLAVGDALELR